MWENLLTMSVYDRQILNFFFSNNNKLVHREAIYFQKAHRESESRETSAIDEW